MSFKTVTQKLEEQMYSVISGIDLAHVSEMETTRHVHLQNDPRVMQAKTCARFAIDYSIEIEKENAKMRHLLSKVSETFCLHFFASKDLPEESLLEQIKDFLTNSETKRSNHSLQNGDWFKGTDDQHKEILQLACWDHIEIKELCKMIAGSGLMFANGGLSIADSNGRKSELEFDEFKQRAMIYFNTQL